MKAPRSDLLKTVVFGTLRVQRTQSTVTGGVVGLLLSNLYDLYAVALFALAIFCFHLSANALNDLADIEVDRINEPNRPLVSGALTKKQVSVLSLSLFSVGVALSYLLDVYLFLLTLTLGVFFLLIYNYGLRLKDNPLGSQLYLSLGSGGVLSYLVGLLVARNINFHSGIFSLFILALASGVVVVTLKDYEGDRLSNKRTLPVVLGLERASKLIALLIVLPVGLYWIPPTLFNFSPLYLLFIAPTGVLRVVVGYSVSKTPSRSQANRHYAVNRAVRFWDFVALVLAAPPILG